MASVAGRGRKVAWLTHGRENHGWWRRAYDCGKPFRATRLVAT